ncbi:MAG TPA: RNA polymerase sigma factor [Pirellulaceae bacterium]|nr:RNA polymerase sigma factor [Pirellulaceae bacterium]
MSDSFPSDGLDRETWPKFLEETHVVAYRYAFRLCGSAADAEDLTQAAYLAAWERRDQLRDAEKAQAWLLAILRHAFFRLRKKRLRERGDGPEVPAEEIADASVGTEATADRLDVQATLADLPEEFRLPLVLFYFENLSYREIAEQLELPVGTVMSRLARAKERLRGALEGLSVAPNPAHVKHG